MRKSFVLMAALLITISTFLFIALVGIESADAREPLPNVPAASPLPPPNPAPVMPDVRIGLPFRQPSTIVHVDRPGPPLGGREIWLDYNLPNRPGLLRTTPLR
jgi:hypothetical protein